MKKLSLHKHLQNPEMLSAMFLKLTDEYVEKGFDRSSANLHVSIILAFPFAGKKKMPNQEIDKYARIVSAIVDAVIWKRN
jgi:hypothetical protein